MLSAGKAKRFQHHDVLLSDVFVLNKMTIIFGRFPGILSRQHPMLCQSHIFSSFSEGEIVILKHINMIYSYVRPTLWRQFREEPDMV